ncbi:MAG TPA: hypothetical protein VIM14_16770 [Polyangia bacterium]
MEGKPSGLSLLETKLLGVFRVKPNPLMSSVALELAGLPHQLACM